LDFGFWILIESKISSASCLYNAIGSKGSSTFAKSKILSILDFGFWIESKINSASCLYNAIGSKGSSTFAKSKILKS